MRSILNISDLDINGKVAIKFWAPWCGPCGVMDKVINPLCKEYPEIDFISVDIQQVKALAKQFKVKTIPTIILISEGEEFSRITGTHTASQLKKEFNKFIGREEKTLLKTEVLPIPEELASMEYGSEELAQAASG